jgi:glycosyltransferase involved in cell wall biosynthesis
MRISVIICTYNRERYLPLVFESVKNQTFSKANFEVIVVNNNSPGNTKELTHEFIDENPEMKVVYVEEFKQGLSFARNRGIVESVGEIVTFVDDDAVIQEDYLEVISHSFLAHPSSVALGGKILLTYESEIPEWENKYLNSLLGYFNPSETAFTFTKKNYPRGSNMAFLRVIFDEIGLFNTELGRIGSGLLGGEEKDLFLRIYTSNKHTVHYEPKAVVYHFVPVERTTLDFIKRQAIGTGVGERLRTLKLGKLAYSFRIVYELIKWILSIGVFLLFSIQGKHAKAKMILVFRFWVSYGLIIVNATK